MTTLPKLLYRGDGDYKGLRNLRMTLSLYQLHTMLLNGGKGHEIFATNIAALVRRHIVPGWNTSHFLSFSENKSTALRFGAGIDPTSDIQFDEDKYTFCYGGDEKWDFALICLTTEEGEWKQLEEGVYEGIYETSMSNYFRASDGLCRLLQIDSITLLTRAGIDVNYLALKNANVIKSGLYCLQR